MSAMLSLYCQAHHQPTGQVCDQCAGLLDYARQRLHHCPFQEKKPTCGNCKIHCYQPARRQQVRDIMRYAGPRMLYRHPLMAIRHLVDGWRKAPKLTRQARPSPVASLDHQEESP